jgi:hypothetical protein
MHTGEIQRMFIRKTADGLVGHALSHTPQPVHDALLMTGT